MADWSGVVNQVKECRLCADTLTPNPLVQGSSLSKILIIGQAPGKLAHQHNLLFSDPSGKRLRQWLNVTEQQFYNQDLFAILPMALCFPGDGNQGDIAPPQKCAKTWHATLLKQIPNIKFTIYLGSYAQQYYLPEYSNLTDAVFSHTSKTACVMPHPSPRNRFWLAKNKEFETKTLPRIRQRLQELINSNS